MDGAPTQHDEPDVARRARWRRKRFVIPAGVLAILAALFAYAWSTREGIADNFIRQQLEAYDIPATYTVERIGARTQILRDIVVGDPANPDFTAKRATVRIRYRLGLPAVGRITLEEPRIYGSYRRGVLSFGSLDKVLFRDSGQPPGLPEFDVAIRDGRGLLRTDYGSVGFKLEGEGRLDDGFDGMIAAIAPGLALPGCKADRVTLYGRITSADGAPRFRGPLRLASLACPQRDLAASDYSADLDVTTDASLANPSGEAKLRGGSARLGSTALQSVSGTVRAGLKDEQFTSRYTFALRGLATAQALAGLTTVEGTLRGRKDLSRFEAQSALEGNGLRPGPALAAALDNVSRAGEGTLLEPLARRMAGAFAREARGSSFEADLRLRRENGRLSVNIPSAEMVGGSGARVLALSRVEYSTEGSRPARFAGNVVTGGEGLPALSGRMERSASGGSVFRLAMAPYEAGGSRLAIPQMSIVQGSGGALGFAGRVEASGALPGGFAQNLRLPVSGRWASSGELSLWRECTAVAFDRLEIANLRFARRTVTLCPPGGGAIVRSGRGGIRVAAGATALDLEGFLGETPIQLRTGPVGFAYPGVMKASRVSVTLGPEATASRFTISDLDARLGDNIAGRFSGADVRLAQVPLDLVNSSGEWDYTAGRMTIAGANFTLNDRTEPDRFEPLAARDARLTLVDNVINATAELRHPGTDRLVTELRMRHNLASGAGHADLSVPGLVFDNRLQPEDLSVLALGAVANARGTITGTGEIDWNAAGKITSTGTFSTDSFDFAAAFGPVKGASGTIVFTDLLGLTTAPGQKLRVASVNPGIEVVDGEIDFQLKGGQLLAVAGGSWPFMGGRLVLRSVDFNFGKSEVRRYLFEIVGLQADQFVAQMELDNISATGTFDGTVPIVFDASGNGRIDNGVLVSREPGGNISYVGALTYENLTPIANFAFDALKSLDYSQMQVVMEGPLTGEIVTRVRFDGVKQGAGAKQNFLTKQFAKLPLQFRINIKAQFYQLMTSLKSLYDPASVKDPREIGLLSDDGKRLLRREVTGEQAEPEIKPGDLIPGEPAIQQ